MSLCYLLKTYPLSLLCIAAIWYICLIRVPHMKIQDIFSWWDKAAHIIMYAGLCALIWTEYIRSHKTANKPRLLVFAIFAPILMSGTIELVQAYFTTTRSGDWLDFLANTIGVLLAGAIGWTFFGKTKSR